MKRILFAVLIFGLVLLGCVSVPTSQNAQAIAPIAQDGLSAEALFIRGLEYYNKGLLDEALADFSKSIELSPGISNTYNNRGVIYSRKGLFNKAIEDFDNAIGLSYPMAPPFFYFNRGKAYAELGQYDPAIKDCTKALEINPKYAEALNNRGFSYLKKSDYDKAIADFSAAIKLKKEYAAAYQNRALTYEAKGDYGKAIEDLTELVKLDPKVLNILLSDADRELGKNLQDARALFIKAFALEKLGRKEEAAQAYKECVRVARPEHASAVTYANVRIKALEKP